MNQLIKVALVDFNGRNGIVVNGHLIIKSDDFDDVFDGIKKVNAMSEILSEALRIVVVEADVRLIDNWDAAVEKLKVRGVVRKHRQMM
jgi:hypothetical protein